MPATAAIDNETLDHLLSVVNDGPSIQGTTIRKMHLPYRPSSRIAASSPSSVSGYIRPPSSWRIMRIDSVSSHSRSGTGLSHTHDGYVEATRCIQTVPASSL